MKDPLAHFKVPYKGLGTGSHTITFQIGDAFFEHFDQSVISNGLFDVQLNLDKKSDHSRLDFDVYGTSIQTCDRCLQDIRLPISGRYTMYVKISETDGEDEDVIYLAAYEPTLDLSQTIYEIIGVLAPIKKVCEMTEDAECDLAVIEKLEEAEDFEENASGSTPWDALKDIDFL